MRNMFERFRSFPELRRNRPRLREVFVDDERVARMIGMRKIADEPVVARNGGNQAVRGRALTTGRNRAEVINFIGLELKKRGPEILDLEIHILQVVPGRRFMAELVNRSAPITANGWREISKVSDAARTVSERSVGFETEIGGRGLAVIKMRDGQNDVPEDEIMLNGGIADSFEIGPVRIAE